MLESHLYFLSHELFLYSINQRSTDLCAKLGNVPLYDVQSYKFYSNLLVSTKIFYSFLIHNYTPIIYLIDTYCNVE